MWNSLVFVPLNALAVILAEKAFVPFLPARDPICMRLGLRTQELEDASSSFRVVLVVNRELTSTFYPLQFT